jgi:hypothetical protein
MHLLALGADRAAHRLPSTATATNL